MEAQGFEVGKIAAMKVVPDKLLSTEVEESEREKAAAAKTRIEKLAPLLGLHKPGPGSEGGVPLLYSPVISLSNGQLRRARIVSSLVRLDEASSTDEGVLQKSLLILDQPYSGLDESSRIELTKLLGRLHESGKPRVILILRRQDELPEGVTHIVDVDTDGRLWTGSRSEWSGAKAKQPSGVEGIRKNSLKGIGKGKGEELARLSNVSVQYGEKVVLDSVSLTLRKGSRLIVKGANGSGKTTLLSLLNGSHPQSYSFSSEDYALFGKARSTPSNASRLLAQKIGYFGPDLLASFPRKGRESGGLSVKDAVACGFAGVFSRVSLKPDERKRVERLLELFQNCLSFRESGLRFQDSNSPWWDRDFIQLDAGSQAVTLFLRAIVNRPAILILDEPFQGMDAVQIDRIRTFIDMLGKEDQKYRMGDTPEDRKLDAEKAADCAVVLVSHYINEWPDGMGEYLLLDNGRVVEHI
jgi:ABC-type molybdenum transport system ATPase subunit/photorepair protein PhrA